MHIVWLGVIGVLIAWAVEFVILAGAMAVMWVRSRVMTRSVAVSPTAAMPLPPRQ